MHLGERVVRSVGSAAGAGRDRQGLHSRQVLLQAHGHSAVVEGVQVGGQEDVATFEEELDGHSHVICGQQMGTASGGAAGRRGRLARVGGEQEAGTGPPRPQLLLPSELPTGDPAENGRPRVGTLV